MDNIVYELIKNTSEYKEYTEAVSKYKLTNRTNMKLEIVCRYLVVPRYKDINGNNIIVCEYGQDDPDLQECLECMEVISFNFEFYCKIIRGLQAKLIERPDFKDFVESGIKMWEDKILEESKERINEFLIKLKEMM